MSTLLRFVVVLRTSSSSSSSWWCQSRGGEQRGGETTTIETVRVESEIDVRTRVRRVQNVRLPRGRVKASLKIKNELFARVGRERARSETF